MKGKIIFPLNYIDNDLFEKKKLLTIARKKSF